MRGEIYSEIARLKRGEPRASDNVSGLYDCFYFDQGNERADAELEIEPVPGRREEEREVHGGESEFIWRNLNQQILFNGTGYKINDLQVVVRYQSV